MARERPQQAQGITLQTSPQEKPIEYWPKNPATKQITKAQSLTQRKAKNPTRDPKNPAQTGSQLDSHQPPAKIHQSGKEAEVGNCKAEYNTETARKGRRSRNKVSVGEPAEGSLSKPARQTREPVPRHVREDDAGAIEGSPRAGDPLRRRARKRPSHGLTNPGAKSVKEHSRRRSPLGAPFAVGTSGTGRASKSKRLSATDISALASMKNAAKCDTWCELQNPVNHRVFERKLRPRPSCRGHVCLGVTHIVALRPRLRIAGAGPETGLPCASARGRPKCDSASTRVAAIGG
ncbi:Hypothetical predicted protein [Olea europaea subsp. europaea]|uniref:Uncharacterized protein n=1 Tax=Olea europaea subsp. europaea TaxID=158383 RepID=A0A8S0SKD3_OLEEU|nr:Hypothetical predicted protein [Olea europaea subsp. europaea]